ncbi:AMP-binding protein [Streptomyces fulvorobeus]|uniref:Acyl-coenzyme A synthetase/AMP-(Fatty) acid ligase n=1 Tax=Streptomyces fulvorobeus TaxID=284028 RepID=A0A7Y9HGN9_9ACTN|nr:AMP-binding protein [Streptomyces fulvorobeus]NYE44117.1 acyl-coenzyme A synthetase/AMP-(fatty) acid ligase [Streptomyces fulvorobeus]
MSEDRARAPGGLPDTLLNAVGRLAPDTGILPGRTAAELSAEAHRIAETLKDQGPEGEAVVLRLPNGPDWVTHFLGLLAAGARPLPVAPDTPDAEVRRLLGQAGGGRILTPAARPGGPPLLDGTPGTPASEGPGVLLPTSGSTGAPQLVWRPEAGWLSEARRYRDGVGLTTEDVLLLPIPLSHAYALGWLCGALLTGAAIRPVPPTALGEAARELAAGATVVALVPTTARLLATRQRLRARRAGPGAAPPAPRLRIAMTGAGPVDGPLDALFGEAYGVGLARNYGSTALGAVLSGPAGLPPLCAGTPLPGVDIRLLDRTTHAETADGPGILQIRSDALPGWHDTGDLAVREHGHLRVLGREGTAVRRGARWVAPLEIESVLRAHAGVRDVRVAARRRAHDGEDGLVAEVVADDGTDTDELRAHAARHLAPHKVPDTFVLRAALPRTAVGKAAAPARYRLTPRALRAARAYKASELLFALHDLGALTALAEGSELADISAETGCDTRALELLLDTAAALGLVSTGLEPGGPAVPIDELAAFVELEKRLSRDLVSREALAAVARTGVRHRPFEQWSLDAELVRLYQGAMGGPSARARSALGLRLLRPRPGTRLVEITAGPGRYLERLLAADPTATGHLWQTGRLAGPVSEPVRAAVAAGLITTGPELPSGDADACVVANGIHDPTGGARLAPLLRTLKPGGRLLVDDLFLPSGTPDGEPGEGAELALDWLTHGGTHWPTLAALTAGLTEAGADLVRDLPFEGSPCHLVLAKEAD